MSTLKEYYNSTVAPAMMKKFGYENVMQIPKLDKVVVNVAAGEAKDIDEPLAVLVEAGILEEPELANL